MSDSISRTIKEAIHSESAEEREHEENGNIQNGFSAFQPSNSSDSDYANNTQTKPGELSISI